MSSPCARVRTATRRSTVSAWPCSSNAMTTTEAPYRRHSRAWRRNSSSPSLRLIELTTPRPWSCWRPASITPQRELSTMTGTFATSGSVARRRRKRVIASTPSSIASSMFTSRITAPLTTWSRATSTALSSPSRPAAISRANCREPGDVGPLADVDERAAGHRDRRAARGPDSRVTGGTSGMTRGAMPRDGLGDRARVLGRGPAAGPATLTRPARAHSPSAVAVTGGVSS